MSSVDTIMGLVDDAAARTLFASSTPLATLDHFRVPYNVDDRLAVDGIEQLRVPGAAPALLWKSDPGGVPIAASVTGIGRDTQVPVFARVVPDSVAEPLLAARGGTWHRARTLTSTDGSACGSIWRADDGSVFLPFHPDEVTLNYWSERYLRVAAGTAVRRLRRRLMLAYYRTRPLLPRGLQIWLRRRFARLQARSAFPRWPTEPCLHDFFDLMFAIVSGIVGGPIPRIAPWPHGHAWALVLTHDVEQSSGLDGIEPVLELERAHGVRSSWNFVPGRYEVDPERVATLAADGFEVGVHGLYHDGLDLESFATWQERLPIAHDAAERWQAVGFRSAALHREWDWMRLLNFDYDSSCPDTDPFEPQHGGCCTWLPFFNGELVVLPLTLIHDHTAFVILGSQDESCWVEKAAFLRDRGGLALLDTHPDYLVDDRIFSAYARFLDRFAADATAWRALPREVSAWWRRRAASSLERDGDTWRVVGPAADEAEIDLSPLTW